MSWILDHHASPRRPDRLPLRVLLPGMLVLAGLLLVALPPSAADPGTSVRDAAWPLDAANASRLWTISRGEGVQVAIVDSGVNAMHPDLRGRVLPGGDFGDGSTGDGTQDSDGPQGHGTEMAGVIAATGENFRGHGVSGLAPRAKILSFGVYRNRTPDPRAVARAIRAAVAKGARIIVIPPVEQGRADVASAVRHAIGRDAVVVSGAGSGTQPATTAAVDEQAPTSDVATLPGVLTVAAVDRHGQIWPSGAGSRHVVVGAPGVGILATAADGTYWTGNDSGFAAAWVAGVAALLRSKHPGWTAAQTIQKIIDTARSRGTGCGRACGYGLVDPLRTLTDTATPTARTNPLLNASAVRRSVTESPFMGVPVERILLFLVSSLAALALYVAVTALFIHRARGRGGRFDGRIS